MIKLKHFQSMPPKKKGLENASIFRSRSKPVPGSIWPTLTIRTEGTELSKMLEEWGASDLTRDPTITTLITSRETTGRITGSRFCIRGPAFRVAPNDSLPANTIWHGVDPSITISFLIDGSTLNFSNKQARNASFWLDLRGLTNTRFYKDGQVMSPEEVDAIPAIEKGACVRVVVFPHSTTHMEMVLLAIPVCLQTLRDKANTWKVSADTLELPTINLTGHISRYSHPFLSIPLSLPLSRGGESGNSLRASYLTSLRAPHLSLSRVWELSMH